MGFRSPRGRWFRVSEIRSPIGLRLVVGCRLCLVVGWVGSCGRDRLGGERCVGGVLPRISIGVDVWVESSIMTGVYECWFSSTLHIRWGVCDSLCLVLLCGGRYGLGGGGGGGWERLGTSYLLISLVLGPLNSLFFFFTRPRLADAHRCKGPPKTPHWSYSAQTRSQNEDRLKRRTTPPKPYLPPQRRTRHRLSHRPHRQCRCGVIPY